MKLEKEIKKMGLFGFGKRMEEEEKKGCCCGSQVEAVKEGASCCCGSKNQENVTCCDEEVNGICCIKVLGAGCKSCHEQFENVKKAVEELGLDVEVEYITDMEKVMTYGVMSMPAIVVNEKVVAMGKVLKTSEVLKLFEKLS